MIPVSSLVLYGLVASTHALIAQSTITNIPNLGGSVLEATALNNSGMAVGFARTPADADQHAFLFSGGVTYDLGGHFGLASGINSAGQICGESTPADTHAFLFSLGGNTDLGTLGGASSTAAAINDAGQVAGRADLADGSQSAFLYSGGQKTNLGTLGGSYSSAAALNNTGQVAGESSTTNDAAVHAFLYTAGSMVDLGTLGGLTSSAKAVNSLGQVAGDSDTTNGESHGFFFSGGIMSDLGTFGGTFSTVNGLNNSGQVVGEAATTNNQGHAFLFNAGVLTDLGSFGGNSTAQAINNLGQIVGTAQDGSGHSVAFLWQNGTLADLNTFLPPNSGWVLQSASLVNDASQVVGVGVYQGNSSWFLLSLPAHRPPIANAGPNQTVECPSTVLLNGSGSTSSDGSPLTYEWRENETLLATGATPSVSLGLGSHSIVLTVTDSQGATNQATVTVTVVDRTPPTVTCPEALIVSAGTDAQAVVPNILGGVTATDSCTPTAGLLKTQSPAAGTVVGIGTYTITVTVTDGSTNENTCTTAFVVQTASDKITICHKGHIRITISSKALDAHLAHGDSIGACTGETP